MLYMISFFFFASYLSLGQANLFSLRQQCWHEYPLSTVNLQSSTAGHNTEHVQLPDRATSSQIRVPASLEHAFAPWSYPPICTEYLQTVGSKLCVYTNVSFSNGRGISVFTTPELARLLLTLPPLRDPAFPHSNINRFSHKWYTEILPGKGTGMLAKRPLGFGERVTAYTPALLAFLESELPTLEREKFFRLAVSQLPQATRDMYLDLATAYGIEAVKYQDVVKANTFQLEIDGHNHLAVFPETSRLNHDCSPNAQYYLDPTQLTHYVHITRPVKKGDEITISYTSPLELTHIRQQHLEQGFHFKCTCSRCTDRKRADAVLQQVNDLQQALNDWSTSSTGSPESAETLLDIYRQEGLEGFMDVPYGFAALAYNAAGDIERALKYAKSAEESLLLKDGEWSPNLRIWKELLMDPELHWSFGRRSK